MKHVWKFLALLCCLGLLGGCGEELPPVQTVEPVQLSSQPQSTEEARKDSATEALESAGETANASQTYGSDEESAGTEEGSDGLPAEDNRQENPKVTLVMVGDILLHTLAEALKEVCPHYADEIAAITCLAVHRNDAGIRGAAALAAMHA